MCQCPKCGQAKHIRKHLCSMDQFRGARAFKWHLRKSGDFVQLWCFNLFQSFNGFQNLKLELGPRICNSQAQRGPSLPGTWGSWYDALVGNSGGVVENQFPPGIFCPLQRACRHNHVTSQPLSAKMAKRRDLAAAGEAFSGDRTDSAETLHMRGPS